MDKLTKACMDILSCDTKELKQNTIIELEDIIIKSLTKEKLKEKQCVNEFNNKNVKKVSKTITVDAIKEATCNNFNESIKNLDSRSRKERIAYTRQVAMYLTRKHLKLSYSAIAELFYRKDHTTILYAYNKISNDLLNHSYTRIKVTAIEKELDI